VPTIELVCVDMAGTTVSDDGVVRRAFTIAGNAVGILPGSARYAMAMAMAIVHETMGQPPIEVFRRILDDEDSAQRANVRFERAYAHLLAAGAVRALPGAVDALATLHDSGIKLCLTTGFAPATRDALLAQLGWKPLIDLALSPADACHGHPWPDMIEVAARTFSVTDPAAIAVVGDTLSDVQAGLAAGASIVAGVLTGSGTRAQLASAGATHVLTGISQLPTLLLPTLLHRDHEAPRHRPTPSADPPGRAQAGPGLVGR
jgi:phosphonatase-like hydrolase